MSDVYRVKIPSTVLYAPSCWILLDELHGMPYFCGDLWPFPLCTSANCLQVVHLSISNTFLLHMPWASISTVIHPFLLLYTVFFAAYSDLGFVDLSL